MILPLTPTSFLERGPFWVAVCTAFVILLGSSATQAQPLDVLIAEAEGFDATLGRIEERYLTPAQLESRFRLETRFNDARVAYFLKDYVRASIILVAVVENPAVRQFDSYRDALYMLGDCLFLLRSYKAARSFFQTVVDLGPGLYYQEAVIRLLEIASTTNNFEGVEELYSRLDSLQNISPQLAYMRGKTLYHQKKYADARQWFQRAAVDAEHAFVARYYEGIAFAAQRQLGPAREVFQSIVREAPRTPRDSNVVDMAYLALGRLAYEEGNFDTAIDHYLQLPRTSPGFERALYELTWSLISRGSHRAALRNVDILLLSNPQPTFVPEAKLLMADLALKLGEHDDARRSYQDVIDTFAPVHDELMHFIAQNNDLEAFFVDLVRRDIEGGKPDYLPPMVADWAAKSTLMESATRLVHDNIMTQEDIDEALAAIEEIEALLGSGSAVEAFPQLAEGMVMGVETENNIIDVNQRLLVHERKLLESSMSAQERQRWTELEGQLKAFQTQYATLPKNREELRAREKKIAGEFSRLRRKLDSVAYDIDTLRVHLSGIDTYLRNNPLTEMPVADRRQVDQIRGELRLTIADLEKVRIALQRQIDITRREVGVGDRVAAHERQLREQYLRMLSERSQFLEALHGRASGESRGSLQRIATARQRIPAASARLHRFFAAMNVLIDERVHDVRQTLDIEYDVLMGYQQELNVIKGDSESAAAAVAHLNFKNVGEQFEEIILRGNVGLIDVSWQQKDDVTVGINQLFEDRAAELQLLRDAFKDVR